MNDVLLGSYAPMRWDFRPPDVIRVVDWNIDRGLRLAEITDFLASQKADLLILQEVDLNARRTGYQNIAELIARKLRMNFVFGREFEELTQERRGSPAYHGQATLSRWPLDNPRVIRFRHQSSFWRPRWYLPRTALLQERLGGRIALFAEVRAPRSTFAVYNLHLESRGDDSLRLAQLKETLADAAQYAGKSPVLLAGDLNLDTSRSAPAATLRQAAFRSAIGLPSPHTTTPRGILGHHHTIDWAYVSGGLEPVEGRVDHNVAASDHFPLSFAFGFRAGLKPRAG